MKKNFFKSVFALMCACMMTTSFVACGSDNDENKPEQKKEEVEPGKLLSGSSEFTVTTTGLDALKAMASDGKVMIRYTYENGSVNTEEITNSTFKKAVDYSFNDKSEIVASMQVYLNDINEEKVREIIGTQFMEVLLQGTIVLKYENTSNNYSIGNGMNYKEFERTDAMVNAAIKSIQRDKERHGIIPLASYGMKVSDASGFMSGSSWLGK